MHIPATFPTRGGKKVPSKMHKNKNMLGFRLTDAADFSLKAAKLHIARIVLFVWILSIYVIFHFCFSFSVLCAKNLVKKDFFRKYLPPFISLYDKLYHKYKHYLRFERMWFHYIITMVWIWYEGESDMWIALGWQRAHCLPACWGFIHFNSCRCFSTNVSDVTLCFSATAAH